MMACALLLLLGQESPDSAAPGPARTSWTDALHGSVSAKHRSRWSQHDSDADLIEVLALDYGDPASDAVTASLTARFAEDLDGERTVDGFFAFDSSDDTRRRGSAARLYSAYVDFRRLQEPLRVRLGRQAFEELPEALPVDGASLLYEIERGVRVLGFVGKPVNLFESSPAGDAAAGGWIEAVPWERGRARLEYLHLKDETRFGRFKDDLLGLTLEQGHGAWSAALRWTALESENRDATARLTGSFPGAGLAVQAHGTWLFERQHAHAYAIDPYALFLPEQEPYALGTLRVSKSLGERFGIDASVSARELVRGGREGDYNHEFVRWTLSPRADGWPAAAVSLSVAADVWRSTGDEVWTLGGDASWRPHPRLTLAAGTAFALWTLDELTGEERERVRSVYATLRWRTPSTAVLDARVMVERTDLDSFTTVEVGVRHAF
jgi:hypothetical protein